MSPEMIWTQKVSRFWMRPGCESMFLWEDILPDTWSSLCSKLQIPQTKTLFLQLTFRVSKTDEAMVTRLASPSHTLTSLQFQLRRLWAKFSIFKLRVCVYPPLSCSDFTMAAALNVILCVTPADLESADAPHFAAEASESCGKRSLHPWESEGAHLLLLFSEAPVRADLLWEQGLLRHSAPMQMKSVASCLLGFKDFQTHDATQGKKKSD